MIGTPSAARLRKQLKEQRDEAKSLAGRGDIFFDKIT
jgi:hypothetical protein